MNEITFTTSFIGGFISFFFSLYFTFTSCICLSFFSGLSVTEIYQGSSKLRILFHTLLFIAGFSTVYLALGAGSSFLGSLFFDYQDYLRVAGGIMLVLFGFLLIGLIKSGIFMREFRLNIKLQKFGTPVGAFF